MRGACETHAAHAARKTWYWRHLLRILQGLEDEKCRHRRRIIALLATSLTLKPPNFRFVLDMLDHRQQRAPVHIAEQKRHTLPDLSVPDA